MTNEEARGGIKGSRMLLDSIVKGIDNADKMTRGWALARTKVDFARMWLGKVLHYLGEEYPYPQSYNPNSKEIAPRADVSEDDSAPDFHIGEENEIAKVKALRQALRDKTSQLDKEYSPLFSVGEKGWVALNQALVNLAEANFGLGIRLEEIQKDKKEEFEFNEESEDKNLRPLEKDVMESDQKLPAGEKVHKADDELDKLLGK